MHERMQQQHVRSGSATSNRLLDQSSDHDSVRQEQRILIGTVHVVEVLESAHAKVERARVRARAGGAFEWIGLPISNPVEGQLDDRRWRQRWIWQPGRR